MVVEVYASNGQHCAFTDLIKYDEEFYLCFRQAKKHMFCKSKIIIMTSYDGEKWEWYSETRELDDLRDPRFIMIDNELYLAVNWVRAKNDVVEQSALLKGRIQPKLTGLYQTGDRNCFITFVLGQDYFSYSPITNGCNRWIGEQRDTLLPSFEDSTEGTAYIDGLKVIHFIRRDNGNSYWLIKDGRDYTIHSTDYQIHCPLLIKNGQYLLGREMKASLNKYDIKANMYSSSMWLYKVNGYKLEKKRQLTGFGDCGYFGYADNLVSYYSNWDETKPDETAIYVEKIKW